MPIYEYQCANCGATLEALQKMSDAPKVDCPECRTPGLKKLVSAASFRLKGGGWYETDFKTGNKKQLAETDSAAKPAAAAPAAKAPPAKSGGNKAASKNSTSKPSSS